MAAGLRWLTLLVAISLAVARAQAPEPRRVTIATALSLASARSPALAAARAEAARARGGVTEARVYPYNPEVAVESAKREGEGESTRDQGVELSQEIEIAGQRGRRIAVAEAELQAAEAALLQASRQLAARITSAFADAAAARDLVAVEEADLELARRLLDVANRRLEAGRATDLDVNVAMAQVGRAERQHLMARAGYIEACAILAESVGLDAASPVEPEGDPPADVESPPLDRLLELGLRNGADLASLRSLREAAERRISLARSERIPNLQVGLVREREADAETITGAGISIGIPLFNRNQGAIAVSRAEADLASQELRARELELTREIVAARARYEAAQASARTFETAVLAKMRDNIALLERSFEAGKLGLPEVVVIRRELLEARREYVEAKSDLWQSVVSLQLATGTIALPEKEKER